MVIYFKFIFIYHAEYVNPGVPIPEDVVSLCKLDKSDLEMIGRADNWGVVGERFNQWIIAEKKAGGFDSVMLVSYNGHEYDDLLISSEGALHGVTDLADIARYSLDAMKLVKDEAVSWAPKGRPTRFKLGGVYEHVTGKEMVDAHDAMGDVIAMCTIIDELDPSLEIGKKHIMTLKEVTLAKAKGRGEEPQERKNVSRLL